MVSISLTGFGFDESFNLTSYTLGALDGGSEIEVTGGTLAGIFDSDGSFALLLDDLAFSGSAPNLMDLDFVYFPSDFTGDMQFSMLTNPRGGHSGLGGGITSFPLLPLGILRMGLEAVGLPRGDIERIFVPADYYGAFNLARLASGRTMGHRYQHLEAAYAETQEVRTDLALIALIARVPAFFLKPSFRITTTRVL